MFHPMPLRAASFLFALLISTSFFFAAPLVATPGLLDPTFGVGGLTHIHFDLGGSGFDAGRSAVVQPDGKILIAGTAEIMFPNFDFAIARLNNDGSLDQTFGADGRVTVAIDLVSGGDDRATAIALQADGKIIVVGSVQASSGGDIDFGIVRLLSDGSLDPTFSTGGIRTVAFDLGSDLVDIANDVVIQPDGKIVVAGSALVTGDFGNDFAVARLTPSGALDADFDDDGKATIAFDLGGHNGDSGEALALQADGKIVIVGAAIDATGSRDVAVLRLDTDGSLDPTFSSDGKATAGVIGDDDVASDVVLDASGRIVTAVTASRQGSNDFGAFRFTSAGVLDTTFSTDGQSFVSWSFAGSSHFASGVAVDANGGVFLGGYVHIDGINDYDFAAVRLDASGEPDLGFGNNGRTVVPFNVGGGGADFASSLILDLEGRIVMVGESTRVIQGDRDFAVLRLTSNAGCVFADGFETGTTSRWTVTVP